MNTLQALLVSAAVLSVADSILLKQFAYMLRCEMPDTWSPRVFMHYGCYCDVHSYRGSGKPVDQLDRCCQEHDKCFSLMKRNSECLPILDSGHTNLYDFSCDNINRKVSCVGNNNECQMLYCECDRKAAECYGRAPWLPENDQLPSDRCH